MASHVDLSLFLFLFIFLFHPHSFWWMEGHSQNDNLWQMPGAQMRKQDTFQVPAWPFSWQWEGTGPRPDQTGSAADFHHLLTWNGHTLSPNETFALALPVSLCSDTAVRPVLGGSISRLAVLTLNSHHDRTGYRFPVGLHTTLIWFYYLQKEHLFSEDHESYRLKDFLDNA